MRKKSASTKSVRLTDAQLAYIEGLKGKTFTEKLSLLVDDAIEGDEKRRAELQAYSSLAYTLSGVRNDVVRLERLAHDLLERMEKAARILPETGQERPP